MTEALSPDGKMQIITSISYNVLAINTDLMNNNYENMHYQYM